MTTNATGAIAAKPTNSKAVTEIIKSITDKSSPEVITSTIENVSHNLSEHTKSHNSGSIKDDTYCQCVEYTSACSDWFERAIYAGPRAICKQNHPGEDYQTDCSAGEIIIAGQHHAVVGGC